MFDSSLSISDKEFDRIKDLMYETTGVFLRPSKKPLVVARLRKRLMELGLSTFAQYLPYLEKRGGGEIEIFVNAITTNETFFFRHEAQFNMLYETVLPETVRRKEAAGQSRELRVWSAACSSGEEPYSLAILLKEFFRTQAGWRMNVIASDVNTEVLEEAQQGLYSAKSVRLVPDSFKKKYFKQIATEHAFEKFSYLVSQQVKDSVSFKQHNLMRASPFRANDVVFLRNVMIYFDKDSKQQVVSHIEDALAPGGYLFISLAENLNDISTRLQFLKSGVFRKAV